MNQEFPRRIRIDLMTPEEKALFDMVGKIEELGAHPLLTDCVVLLGEARSKLSDWVDLQAAEHRAHPTPLESAVNPATWVINPNNITPPAISGERKPLGVSL